MKFYFKPTVDNPNYSALVIFGMEPLSFLRVHNLIKGMLGEFGVKEQDIMLEVMNPDGDYPDHLAARVVIQSTDYKVNAYQGSEEEYLISKGYKLGDHKFIQ